MAVWETEKQETFGGVRGRVVTKGVTKQKKGWGGDGWKAGGGRKVRLKKGLRRVADGVGPNIV